MKSELITLTGLWEKNDKNGEIYMVGSVGQGVTVYIFPNTEKKSDNQPDHWIKLSRRKPKVEQQDQETAPCPF